MEPWRRILAGIALAGLTVAQALTAAASDIRGEKPGYILFGTSAVPNEQAIARRVWVPGLADGFVPQGLTVAGESILVSGYVSADPKVDRGPCRVYRIDAESGRTSGSFELTEDCGHAGGLAWLGNGFLVVSDTRRLYRIDLEKAIKDGKADAALTSVVKLAGNVKGSFVDFDGKDLWAGSFERDEAKSRMHRFPVSIFDEGNGKTVREDMATAILTIPVEAQGAAFDREGKLWVSSSTSQYGMLRRIDPVTGQRLASYQMPAGTEDIGFDSAGMLWAVSEAGAMKYQKWSTTFPLVFRIDVARMK
jgi:sugar lactone lactonase YvrE